MTSKKGKETTTLAKIAKISLVLLSVISIFGCSKTIKEIEFLSNNQTVYIGQEMIIDYEITPEDANDENILITSSNEDVLQSVNKNIFKAIKEGTSILTISHNDKEYDNCVIEVKPIEVESIKNANDNISIGIGNSYEPEIVFYPSDATYKEYTLLTSNEQIAKIDNNKIIGVNEGLTEITALTSNNITTKFTVNIIPVIANSIEILNTSRITIGDEVQLSLKWDPANVTYKNVEWGTSDSSIAYVDTDGILKAKKDGIVTIYAKESSNNQEVSKKVTINPIEVSDLVVTARNYEIYKGDATQIYVDFLPNNVTYKVVTYESNNENILTVSNSGYVSAVGIGVAKILVRSKNGINKTVEIEVKERPVVINQVRQIEQSAANTTSSDSGSYILNTNTKKFHRTTCNDINKMKEANKKLYTGTREEIINMGYSPCGHCKP